MSSSVRRGDLYADPPLQAAIQTWHSIKLKNLDLTKKKKSGSGGGGGGGESGSWSNRLQKEITHPKRRLFVVSFFYSATRNVLNCQTSSYVFFSCLFCLCVLFLFSCLFPQNSQWLAELLDLSPRIFLAKFLSHLLLFCRRKRRDEPR